MHYVLDSMCHALSRRVNCAFLALTLGIYICSGCGTHPERQAIDSQVVAGQEAQQSVSRHGREMNGVQVLISQSAQTRLSKFHSIVSLPDLQPPSVDGTEFTTTHHAMDELKRRVSQGQIDGIFMYSGKIGGDDVMSVGQVVQLCKESSLNFFVHFARGGFDLTPKRFRQFAWSVAGRNAAKSREPQLGRAIEGVCVSVEEPFWDEFAQSRIVVNFEDVGRVTVNGRELESGKSLTEELKRRLNNNDVDGVIVYPRKEPGTGVSTVEDIEKFCQASAINCFVNIAVGHFEIIAQDTISKPRVFLSWRVMDNSLHDSERYRKVDGFFAFDYGIPWDRFTQSKILITLNETDSITVRGKEFQSESLAIQELKHDLLEPGIDGVIVISDYAIQADVALPERIIDLCQRSALDCFVGGTVANLRHWWPTEDYEWTVDASRK